LLNAEMLRHVRDRTLLANLDRVTRSVRPHPADIRDLSTTRQTDKMTVDPSDPRTIDGIPVTPTETDLTPRKAALLRLLESCGRVAVAFSGGVDSAVLAKAAQLACGDNAVAVTAVSPSLASGELDEARRLADSIGIRHVVLQTDEMDRPEYRRNAPDRCFFCKTELYSQLHQRLAGLRADVIVNGANLDDRGDHRPGMQAAREHGVRSPLLEAGFTKADVRELARLWELPVWDKPAMPCLSSRIAYGVEVTEERLRRVDAAERFLREEFGLREFRVRHEANDLARLELPVDRIGEFLEPARRERIAASLRSLGFRFVTIDLDGFRSGSMNAVIPVEELRTF
jgi:pyridinium-3,5-biscarboxylic acid mononucleotide sulfurtransferase